MTNKFFRAEITQIRGLVFSTYLISLTLDLMLINAPSSPLNTYLPNFTLLTLLFWTSSLHQQSHLMSAFLLGLLLDAATNSLLGLHAALFLLLTFFMLRVRQKFKAYPRWHQSLLIGFYLMLFLGFEAFMMPMPSLTTTDLALIFATKIMTTMVFIWPFQSQGLQWLLNKYH